MQHLSDCAIHNEPAYPKGACDCYEERYAEVVQKYLELSFRYLERVEKYCQLNNERKRLEDGSA